LKSPPFFSLHLTGQSKNVILKVKEEKKQEKQHISRSESIFLTFSYLLGFNRQRHCPLFPKRFVEGLSEEDGMSGDDGGVDEGAGEEGMRGERKRNKKKKKKEKEKGEREIKTKRKNKKKKEKEKRERKKKKEKETELKVSEMVLS
jgi:hypothetical protein